ARDFFTPGGSRASAKKSTERRRRRSDAPKEGAAAFKPKNLDAMFAQMGPAPVGPLQPAPSAGVVTLGDLGFDCTPGRAGFSADQARLQAHPGTPSRISAEVPNGWMMGSSPCRAAAGPGGVMSTSPLAAGRPRPPAVCLPMGALSFAGCTSPAPSPQASGDASCRTLPPCVSPTAASGDASTRTLYQGVSTPLAAMMAASPKAFHGTDASSRTPVHACALNWAQQMPGAAVAGLAAEAASPC
ncbi:unnamed protein product, partial [Polarella glacialis]